MIEIKNVSHRFGDHEVLRNINLNITEHRVGVVGSNGSGKSTFARLLNGLLVPESGEVLVDRLNTRKSVKAIRRKVGFVFQNPDNQIILPIVEDDIGFGLKNLKLNRAELEVKVSNALKKYNLERFRKYPVHSLSGGQKQLLAISSVLIMEPEYVVFDEPTTLLDLRNKNKIIRVIQELEQTVILISHDLQLFHDFERVIFLDQGQVIIDDTPAVVLPFYEKVMA